MPSAAYEVEEEEELGYGFGNKETRLQLKLLDDLQKLGVSKYIDLPQLVVVGDQSTGKSSVLEAVTEIPFPVDDGMRTRFATEIVLRRTTDEVTSTTFSIIPGDDEKEERKQTLRAWHPTGLGQDSSLNKATMKKVFDQAEKMIFGNVPTKYSTPSGPGQRNRLSESTLCITRQGRDEIDFKIVDVPGLVRGSETNDDEDRTAKSLVEKYLKNVRSIIVVVIDVVDLERQGIFQMLNRVSDQENRVIGVINKCDTKQKESANWVFDLIENDPAISRKYLKEGWYGLRNRQPSERSVSDQERDENEEAFFQTAEWVGLDREKLGRHKLKNALETMLNRHIRKNIPGLLSEIQKKAEICNSRIQALGEPRTTNPAQFMLVNKIAIAYSQKVRSGLKGHYNDLNDSKTYIRKQILDDLDAFQQEMAKNGLCHAFRTSAQDGDVIATCASDSSPWAPSLLTTPTYSWIRTAIHNYRSGSQLRRANPEVNLKLWKEQTNNWSYIAAEALRSVEHTVTSINDNLFSEVCQETELRLKLTNWLNEEFAQASQQAQEELQRLLVDERETQMSTLDPRKSRMEEGHRSQRIEEIKRRLTRLDPRMSNPLVPEPRLELREITPALAISTFLQQDDELIGVIDTHDNLAAHYEIALYRFIDNFATQVVERHLLGPHGPLRLFNSEYVTQRLYGSSNSDLLNSLAGEDPVVAQTRADLMVEKASLDEGRKKVLAFRMSAI